MRAICRQSSEPIEPAGAGDEDGGVGDVRRDRVQVDLDRLPAEHVLHLHRPDLTREVQVAGDQLVDPRQRLDRNGRLAGDVHDTLAHRARRGGNRDQHLVRAVLAEDPRQLVRRSEHAHVVQAEVLLARVVVDQADRRVAERRALQHLLDDQLRRVAGTDDDHLLAARDQPPAGRPLHHRPREHARAGDERKQEQPVHHRDRARQAHLRDGIGEVDDDRRDEAGDGHAARGAPHVAGRDVAPPAVVEAEEDEDRDLDQDHDPDRLVEERLVVGRDVRVEAQPEREVPGDSAQAGVDGELPEAMPVERQVLQRAAPTATLSRTTLATRSWVASSIPAHIGRARFSRAARSVSGSDPGSQPRKRKAGWRWRGVT